MAGYLSGRVSHGMRVIDLERCFNLCARKRRDDTYTDALATIARISKHDPERAARLRAYHCEYCHGYHLGTPRKERGEYE